MYVPEKNKDPSINPEGSNEMNLEYVNVSEEKEKSIILPLVTLVVAILTFAFYPYQAFGLIVAVFTFVMTRNHAWNYKPLTIVGVTLSVIGLIIGFSGISVVNDVAPIFVELSSDFTCEGMDFVIDSACYAEGENKIYLSIESSRNVHKFIGDITSNDGTVEIDILGRTRPDRVRNIELSYNAEVRSAANQISLTPIIRSFVNPDNYLTCFEYSQTRQVTIC